MSKPKTNHRPDITGRLCYTMLYWHVAGKTNEVLNRLIGCQPSQLDNWISKYQQCQFQSTSLKVSSIASLYIFVVTGDRRKPEIHLPNSYYDHSARL
jgi:hypothetical protein